jgi:hypothetical protein
MVLQRTPIIYTHPVLWDHRPICGPSLTETSLCGACIFFSHWGNINGFCNGLICFVRVAAISIQQNHRFGIAWSRSQFVSIDRFLDGTETTMARRRNNSSFVRAELGQGAEEGALPWKHAQVLRDVTLLTRLSKLQELEFELWSVGIATHPTAK